ncbi:MAG: CarD family transcriptional regulator [Clostridiales Family XIII bacterium]|jgi:CarD family transcriptional regulator|nr:CarD family transcriptional regulator [Clostridiales Family XIII bacterium]
MFSIGDKIVYPMHGAGTIEAIEEQVYSGEKRTYYILLIPQNDIRIMVPCDRTEDVGVRGIIKKTDMAKVSETLSGKSTEMAKVWNRRYRDNMEKLKTGQITHVAEVVRDLMRVDREKRLSTGEKKMLSNAKQILISELSLVSGKGTDELSLLIEQQVMA